MGSTVPSWPRQASMDQRQRASLPMRAPTLRCCLTVLASASIALVSACGGRPTPREIKDIISSSPKFQEPVVAYVPRRIALIPQAVGVPNGTDRVNNYNPDFFRTLKVQPYTVAKISAPLAVLWASGVVDVSDAATARTF